MIGTSRRTTRERVGWATAVSPELASSTSTTSPDPPGSRTGRGCRSPLLRSKSRCLKVKAAFFPFGPGLERNLNGAGRRARHSGSGPQPPDPPGVLHRGPHPRWPSPPPEPCECRIRLGRRTTRRRHPQVGSDDGFAVGTERPQPRPALAYPIGQGGRVASMYSDTDRIHRRGFVPCRLNPPRSPSVARSPSRLLSRTRERRCLEGAELQLEPGGEQTVRKKVSVKQHSTRTHYPGMHAVDVMINGRVESIGSFTLVET